MDFHGAADNFSRIGSTLYLFAQTLWAEANTVHSSMLICTHLRRL